MAFLISFAYGQNPTVPGRPQPAKPAQTQPTTKAKPQTKPAQKPKPVAKPNKPTNNKNTRLGFRTADNGVVKSKQTNNKNTKKNNAKNPQVIGTVPAVKPQPKPCPRDTVVIVKRDTVYADKPKTKPQQQITVDVICGDKFYNVRSR